MTLLFNRWLPALTLASWAAILLYITTGGRIGQGRIGDYLAPPFIPGALVAGLILAFMAFVFAFAPADEEADCCATDTCSHALSRFTLGKVFTFLILLLPIAVAPFASKTAFQSLAMRNRSIVNDGGAVAETARVRELKQRAAASAQVAPAPATATAPSAVFEPPLPTQDGTPAPVAATPQPPITDYLQRTPDGYIVAEILDLLYAAQDNLLRKDFDGKAIQLIGQLMPETTNNPAGNRFKAVRMFMTCCAADARPVATLVETDKTPDLPEMTWVKINGTATFPIENGRRTAVLKAKSVEKTEPPEESMLY